MKKEVKKETNEKTLGKIRKRAILRLLVTVVGIPMAIAIGLVFSDKAYDATWEAGRLHADALQTEDRFSEEDAAPIYEWAKDSEKSAKRNRYTACGLFAVAGLLSIYFGTKLAERDRKRLLALAKSEQEKKL